MPPRPTNGSPTRAPTAEKVQAILDSKRLTLYQVSQKSAKLYGRSSPYFLPHNLYYDLGTGSFRPSIHQIVALSRISGYRVPDWLRVFGFNLEDITQLQVLLPSKRTFVLDTSLTDPNDWTPWIDSRPYDAPVPPIAPLAKLVQAGPARRIGSFKNLCARSFLYAKIGTEEALAFPDLLSGSIVRVNPEIAKITGLEDPPLSNRIFLVEHSKGFCCSRIRILNNSAIVPFDQGLRHAQVELHRPLEARVWGAVDFEFRPLLRTDEPQVSKDLARRWKPHPLRPAEDLGQLLQGTRRRRNLSVREAAQLSRTIAEVLKNDRYTTSPSSLSDYELRNTRPRDFHKIVTLCSIYGLEFESVIKRMGVDLADAGTESMTDGYVSRAETPVAGKNGDPGILHAGFLERLLEERQEVPFFLRHCLGYFSDFAHVAWDDLFWVGGDENPLHPYLEKALVVMVNRRRKTALHYFSKPVWQQPIYIVLKRNGNYLAACCGVENHKLVVHSYARDFRRDEEYRLHEDAEVVGQIVAIARRIH